MSPSTTCSTLAAEGIAVGRLLVLPGAAYTVDHPLLFWSAQVAHAAGWDVTTVRWVLGDSEDAEPRAFVERAAADAESAAPPAPVTAVLAKSLGTYAASWANERGHAGIWLTPLLGEPVVASALRAPGPASLVVAGGADPAWRAGDPRGVRGDVVVVEGADHALHVGTDWRASIDALRSTVGSVERHLARLVESDHCRPGERPA